MHTTKDPPIHNQDSIQACTRPMHSRLVIMIESEDHKDIDIPGMKINIDAVHTAMDIPKCMAVGDIQEATIQV